MREGHTNRTDYYQLTETISRSHREYCAMPAPSRPTLATRSIHTEKRVSELPGDVVTPIHLSSTFELDEVPVDTAMMDLDPAAGEYLYTRLGNPTRQALEERLADIAGATHGFAMASGTTAVLTTILATVEAGQSIVAFDDLYGGSLKLLDGVCQSRLNMDVELVDARDVDTVAEAISADTALVLMETPTNPLMHLCDIRAIADLAEDADIPLAVDNTFASPFFQRPLELGADIEIHSTTKYLNGHSDGLGGAIITDDDAIADEIAFLQRIGLGNPLAPFDAYLVLRGMKTLSVRMRAHENNARAIAKYLEEHPRVRTVRYPGLDSHPQHDLAAKQMRGFGGMLSFDLDGDLADARRFLESLETFSLAVSLGGVESLIELPVEMTHDALDSGECAARGISESLIRVSVGIEDVDDLIADLDRGFQAAFGGND